MGKTERIYRRTQAGQQAYQSPNSGLGHQLRSILGLIETDTHEDLIRASLRRRYAETQILDWLDQLETLNFLESEEVKVNHDLDFTGELNLAELRAAAQKAAAS